MSELSRHATVRPLRKINVGNGQILNVRELDFDLVREPWAEYELKDGGRLRHRSTVTKVFHIYDDSPDPQPRYDEQGEPVLYIVSTAQSVSAI